MKTIIMLRGLDCPNCAAQIQKEAAALPGVEQATVDLIHQKIILESRLDKNILLKKIEVLVHAHEPHVQVSFTPDAPSRPSSVLPRIGIGTAVYLLGLGLRHFLPQGTWGFAVLLISYGILGYDVLLQAVRNIAKGKVFDENFLMGLSSAVALAIGEGPEAVAVMLFYQLGEYFQDRAVDRSRRSIAALMDICPDRAEVLREGEYETVDPAAVRVGEYIRVSPGEKIPLDGMVEEGSATLDTRALTGESRPRIVHPGEEVLSGCINTDGLLVIRVTKAFGQSTVSKILELTENAARNKAPTENFITTFARYYTPAVVILAGLLAVIPPLFVGQWLQWIRRGCVFLVISCPCALVISVPLAFFGGIGAASRRGILVKGGNYLEALNRVDTVAFDKTGTLTQGVFRVTQILPAAGFTEQQVLAFAAKAESFSGHPIALSIGRAYGQEVDTSRLKDYQQIPGQGVTVTEGDKIFLAGNERFMGLRKIPVDICDLPGTKVYVAAGETYAGCILISDILKPGSKNAVTKLKAMGIKKTAILSGDEETAVDRVREELGIDSCYARLLPQEKVERLEGLGGTVAYVGDGINDAPVLARADVGVAMGALGSDAAIEAADVVLMTDEPGLLAEAIRIAKVTRRIVGQNILMALGIKGAFLVLGALGLAGMWLAVFADVGVALLAVANSLRVLKK